MLPARAPPGEPFTVSLPAVPLIVPNSDSGSGVTNSTGLGDCLLTASVSWRGSHGEPKPQENWIWPVGSLTVTSEMDLVYVEVAVPGSPAAVAVAVARTSPIVTVIPPAMLSSIPRAIAIACVTDSFVDVCWTRVAEPAKPICNGLSCPGTARLPLELVGDGSLP